MEPLEPTPHPPKASDPDLVRRAFASLLILAAALLPSACGPPAVPNLDSLGTTIVCLGDSITAGVGADRGGGYPERLAERLGTDVINAGVPGNTAEEGLARLDAVLARDPWLVIIELGGNDLLHRVPEERTEAALRGIVQGVLDAGAVPLVVRLDGPPLLGGRLDDVFDRLEDDFGVPMVEDVLDDVLMSPSLKSDTIHPNGAGYARLAEAVADEVRPLIEARRR